MYDPEKVMAAAKAFGLVSVTDLKVLSDGLMHKTFKVETIAGTYILQQLHPLLSSVETVRDFMHVTEHLRDRGFFAPLCLRTPRGDVMYRDGDVAYRVYTYVPGQTVSIAPDARRVREAGKIVGRFHEAMHDFALPFESGLVLHETEKIHAGLKAIIEAHSASELMTPEVEKLAAELLAAIPTYYLPADLPLRPAHGDLKITNILFDMQGNAVSLIDFDTCNKMMLPIEMGDAFRSWCGNEEDDAANEFSLERFKAGWGGYVEVSTIMTPKERSLMIQGIQLITLELSARFLTDYFNDSYFGWDAKRYASRREHNLARAIGQKALFESIRHQRDAAEEIIARS